MSDFYKDIEEALGKERADAIWRFYTFGAPYPLNYLPHSSDPKHQMLAALVGMVFTYKQGGKGRGQEEIRANPSATDREQ